MNALKMKVFYKRRFVGDATPFVSDALAYTVFSYRIDVIDNGNIIKTVKKNGLTYHGGVAMNLQVMVASLRDKKYEIKFANARVNTVVKRIVAMPN
ncbi:MAG: hypothetical protein ACI9NY_001433 [Kiritimatiellia bacterium]|jgi:hypothetical protein